MKKKNGFTLVELLAVIVVLALVMVIAIPSILNVMNDAKKQSFVLYAEKVVTNVQTTYLYDSSLGNLTGKDVYIYDITQDLDLSATGSYQGYVAVLAANSDDNNLNSPQYILFMRDNNYQILGHNITNFGMPTKTGEEIVTFKATDWNTNYGKPELICDFLNIGLTDKRTCGASNNALISSDSSTQTTNAATTE